MGAESDYAASMSRSGTWRAGAVAFVALAAMAAPASASVVHSGGIAYVTKSVTVAKHATVTKIVSCPSGMHVVGGGARTSAGYKTLDLRQTFPADRGDKDRKPDDGWGDVLFNQSTKKIRVSAVAACGREHVDYAIDKVSLPNSTSEQEHDVACPPGEHVFGGGVRGPANRVRFDSTFPSTDTEWGSYYESVGGTAKAKSYAVCLHATPVMRVDGIQNAPNARDGMKTACPGGTRAYGGGLNSNATRPGIILNSAAPDPAVGQNSGFQAFADIDAAYDVQLTTYAMCGPTL
jgi:hypothetical protein